jgi:hypothetical protein
MSRPAKKLLLAGLVTGASLVSTKAAAYRPFDGTDAEIAEFGELEIEFGTAYTVSRAIPLTLQMPAVVVNLGIWPRLELVLEATNQLGKLDGTHPTDRFADTHLFLKAMLREGFAQEKTGPSIALEAGPWLPNPNGEAGIGASADLITSFELGRMVFHVNLEAAYDLAKHPELFASVILEGPRANTVRPVTEIFAQHAFTGGPTTYSALAGVIWKARKEADLDFAVEGLSTDGVPMARIRAGITFRAPVWHAHP